MSRAPLDPALLDLSAPIRPRERDHILTLDSDVAPRSLRDRAQRNLDALRLLKQLEADGRDATPGERRILARYSGWGALSRAFDNWPGDLKDTAEELRTLVSDDEWKALRASTPNAHYTSLEVIDAMWQGALRLGIPDDARVLEPALGVGHFFGLQPAHVIGPRTGVELEPLSARLARALYPDSGIRIGAFQDTPHLGGYDLVIGNVPFGRYGVRDSHYHADPVVTRSIHDYFLGRALDEIRPGGIVALITSRYTMDKVNDSFRRWADERANLVAALRLPGTAFERSAGTEVVTDILFLQRRFDGAGRGVDWIDTGRFEAKGFHDPINTYFLEHPEHVLGALDLGRGLYNRYELRVEGDLDPARLRHAIMRLPEGIVPPRDGPRLSMTVPEIDTDAPARGKLGAYVLDNGTVARIRVGRLEPVDATGARLDRLRGMVELRDTAQTLLRAQLDDEPQATLDSLRANLNQRYDSFVRRFGPLSSRTNSALFRDDPDSGLLLALEEGYDREHNTARKAPLFSRRTLTPYVAPTRAGNAVEALSITLGEAGRVHWPRLVELLDKPASEVAAELGELVFEDPAQREWVTREEYLSGDVRAKLDAAVTASLAEPAFERNVRALQAVLPRELTPADIKVTLGAPWIPTDDIRAFVAEHLFPGNDTSRLDLRYVESLANWVLHVPGDLSFSIANRTTWGTERAPALNLLEDALNQRVPTVSDFDAETQRSIPNLSETVAAREKQQQIKDAFEQWLWTDPERAERLAREYNRRFNAYRSRRYDGSHLTFPGMDRSSLRGADLAQHQKDGVWRQLQQRTTLLALPVGAGKTYTMIAAAQEGRRLGLIRKALFVVPNALVEQWGDSFQRLYPTARVLVAGREHLAEGRRQEFMARTATSDYEAVIVAHSSFGKLALRAESEAALLQKEADRLEEAILEARENGASIDRTVVKQVEIAKRRLELRIANLASRHAKDDGLRFEDLGFDAVFVDEAHAFKNLMLVTKMNRVAGLPATESARAWDMYAKTRHVLAGGGRVVFATATPCTNTLAEVFNMQRYLQEDTLERLGITHFDAWAATFARSVTAIELAPDGSGYRSATRFAAFNNAPELSLLFSQVTELRTEAELQLQRPELRGGRPELVVVPGSDELRTFVKSLGARAELVRARRVTPDVDNMLKVTGDGRRAALDLREVDLRPAPRQKVDVLAERVAATWREHTATRATQVVFCDLSTPKRDRFSFYVALREALVERGLPDSEIAFIHDAATDRDKLQLFQAVNDGRVRVVMGSTEKLGTGVNIQERLIAAHHADAPWRPADVEQRNGRILRPGNGHAEVQVCYYLTEGSFDSYMWQTLETKQRFIDQLLRGEVTERTVEDIGATAALTAAECKALATGRPEILEVVKLDTEIRRLGALQAHHADNRRHLTWDVQASEQRVVSLARDIEEWRADLATVRAARDEAGDRSPAVEIGGKTFGGDGYRKSAGQALAAVMGRMQAAAVKSRDTELVERAGAYAGLGIHVGVKSRIADGRVVFEPRVWLRGQRSYDVNGSLDKPETLIASLEAQAHPSHIEDRIAGAQRRGEEELRRIADLRRELAKPFEHDAALAQLRERRDALVSELQLRDDGDVIAQEPAPGRLTAPALDLRVAPAIER